MVSGRKRRILLLAAGTTSAGIYAGMTRISMETPALFTFVGLYGAAFVVFVLVAFLRKPAVQDRSTLGLILGFAVVFRLIMLFGDPLFEDDMHRYLWDGKVWASGINPYLYPPDDFFVEHLRDENWMGINFKYIPTIYPPFAQWIFRVAYYLAPNNVTFLKGIFLLFDFGVIALLVWMLRRLALPLSAVVLYDWNPLVIKEFANSGHLDVMCVFFVMLFCAFALRENRPLAAGALGLAVLSKLYPLVFFPALIRYFRIRDFALCLGLVGLGYMPFWEAEELVFEGLGTYAKHWEFNDSGFLVLRVALEPFVSSPYLVAKVLVIFSLGGLGLYLSGRARTGGPERLRVCFLLLGGLLLFGPTVDTWYLTWIVPFLCFFPKKSWILLTGTCVIAYCYFWQGQDFWWIRVVEYVPFYLCLAFEFAPRFKHIFLKPNILRKFEFLPGG